MPKKRFSVVAISGTYKKTLATYDEIEQAIKLADKYAKKEVDTVVYRVYDSVMKEIAYTAHK